MMQFTGIKQILFDADDTLWKNNIYYLRATADFLELLELAGTDKDTAQAAFDELELWVVNERGYGSKHFVYILETLFRRFISTPDTYQKKRLKSIVDDFNMHTVRQPLLMKAVSTTLQALHKKYRLFILTKGDRDEQRGKIERSGLLNHFDDYFIPPEKDDLTFKQILNDTGWLPQETCMVGNSPKSDINPALRSGLYAIYIHYDDTWKLDREPFEQADGRFITVERFSDLKTILLP